VKFGQGGASAMDAHNINVGSHACLTCQCLAAAPTTLSMRPIMALVDMAVAVAAVVVLGGGALAGAPGFLGVLRAHSFLSTMRLYLYSARMMILSKESVRVPLS